MIANVCQLSNTGGNLGSEAIPDIGTTADHLSECGYNTPQNERLTDLAG